MTTLVAIGDTHLRSTDPWNIDRLTALDQIIDEGLQEPHLGAWLWPGDIFDATSTPDDRNAVASRLIRMGAVAPVVICYGNHDAPNDLAIFRNLNAVWPIYIADAPEVFTVPLATGETAAIFALPYPQRAGFVAAGLNRHDAIQTADQILDVIFIDAAGRTSDVDDRACEYRRRGCLNRTAADRAGDIRVAGASRAPRRLRQGIQSYP